MSRRAKMPIFRTGHRFRSTRTHQTLLFLGIVIALTMPLTQHEMLSKGAESSCEGLS